MPIRESEKARYPADWKAISAEVRADAGNKCEQCSVPNGALIFRMVSEDYDWPVFLIKGEEGDPLPVFKAEDGEPVGVEPWGLWKDAKPIRVALTVAHLDHQPENCARENLRAWCQRCHLRYDAKHHAANSSATRRGRKATGDLFATAVAKGGQ